LILEKWYKKHTKKQRGLFHAIVDKIAIHSGMSDALIKEGIKEQYGVKIAWKDMSIPKPSSMMSTVEYNMLINGAIVEAADMGINVRDYRNEYEQLLKRQAEDESFVRQLDDLPIPAESYEILDEIIE
jgi:hypothetical protein